MSDGMPNAQEVIDKFVKPEWKDVAYLVASTATLQERNRCARIAEDKANEMVVDDEGIDAFAAGMIISQAILNPSNQTKE